MLADTISSKSLTFTFKATEISYDVIISMLDKLLQKQTKEKKGKQSIKELRKKGSLQVVEITDKSLKELQKYFRKFNIDYSLLKNKTEDKQYTLFFRNYDAELLNKVMESFIQNKFREKDSITEKIKRVKEQKNKIEKGTHEKDKTKVQRKEVER